MNFSLCAAHTFYMKKILAVVFALFALPLLSGGRLLPENDISLTIFAGDTTYSFCYPEIDLCPSGFYLKDADMVVERIRADTVVLPTDAAMFFHPNARNKFSVTAEKNGKQIDCAGLKEDIKTALARGEKEVRARFITLYPAVTQKDLGACTHKRSGFSTEYGSSSAERKSNVSLAARALNGCRIEDGEVFSFNETVGERTEERGYKIAKIISDGRFTDGIGGGVCQLSTTLYNAALLAGLDICERHPHTLAVSYVERSFDAMVSSFADLKFINDTGGPLFIETEADGKTLTVNVYGRRSEYTIKRVSETIFEEDAGYELTGNDGSLDIGEDERIILPQHKKIRSRCRLYYYSGGKLIKKTLLHTDDYRGSKGVKMVRNLPVNPAPENKKAP